MALRDGVERLRTPANARRLAVALWIVCAVIVWNAVFDQIVMVAARDYVTAAKAAVEHSSFLLIDGWMRPALGKAFIDATAAGGAVLLFGLAAVAFAARRGKPPRADGPCA
jgi:ABC-type dipeptide/oligopeptide/nickel transport system permease subunit